MSAETLTTLALGQRVYRVTGGKEPHRVSLEPVACDCADFIYKGVHRTPPMCKHVAAVLSHRAVEPLADMLDNLTDAETLDVIDPSHGDGYEPLPEPVAVDPEDRAVAIAALEKWGELRRLKPKPNGYYWVAQLGQTGRVA